MHGRAVHCRRGHAPRLCGDKGERGHPAFTIATVQHALRGTKVEQQCDDFAAINTCERLLTARLFGDFSKVALRERATFARLRGQQDCQLVAIGFEGFRILPPVKQGAQSLDAGDAPEKRGQACEAVLVALLMNVPALFKVAATQRHPGVAKLAREARCFTRMGRDRPSLARCRQA